jgi:hypothetical protein
MNEMMRKVYSEVDSNFYCSLHTSLPQSPIHFNTIDRAKREDQEAGELLPPPPPQKKLQSTNKHGAVQVLSIDIDVVVK